MTSSRSVLVLQHQDDAPAGLLAGVLAARPDLTVRTLRADREELPEPAADVADAVVVLGSSASAVGAGSVPWVAPEVTFLRRLALRGVPVLGICFGAQALAAALGGAVHRLDRPQVGWIEVPTADPQAFPGGPWLTWHEDGLVPPPRARVLAQDGTGVQAFAAGPHLGVQVHPEVTAAIVERWIAADRRTGDARPYDPARLRERTRELAPRAAPNALRLFSRWLGR